MTLEQGAGETRRRAAARLLDDLRGDVLPPHGELLARARRLGADLTAGATALCVGVTPGAAGAVHAAIEGEIPGALLAGHEDGVQALLPAPPGAAERGADAAAHRVARSLRRRAAVGLSPVEPAVEGFGRALRIARLAMAVGVKEGLAPDDLVAGSWRLLLRTAVGAPGELESLVSSTIGAAREHELGSPAALLETLRAYFDNGANMNATAAAIYAHRHTIAYRLERIRELTGHDPQTPAGQEPLALGLKALAVREAAAALGRS